MYKFCNKCGNVTLGNKYLEEKCWVCGNILMPVPTKYIQENEIFTDKETASKTATLIEELVKTSPEFDQYLFDHRDEILTKKSAEFDAALEHGKAVLEGRDKGNKYGVECPYCHATNVSRIGFINRAVSTSLLGLASSKIGKTYKCNNCGSTW